MGKMATDTYSFHISRRLAEDCAHVCDEQGFECFSDLLNYAVRNYRERILRHEVAEIRHVRCPKEVVKRVRIRRSMLEDISRLTGIRVPEVPEYALHDYIENWLVSVIDPSDFEPEW